jgi:aminopeptidase
VYDPDFERLAGLIADCSRLAPGETVTILVQPVSQPLAEALIVECYRRGATPLAVVRLEEAEVAALCTAPAEYLSQRHANLIALIGQTDVIIPLYCQYQNPALQAQIPPAKMAAYMQSRVPFQKVLYDGGRRIVITDFPTSAQAEFYGVSFPEYWETFWRAMEIDYEALRRRVADLTAFLQGREEVHLLSAKGTDVRLRIGGRQVFGDDGLVGLPGETDRDILLNLPSGEVCLAPQEDGAEGVVVFDFAFVGGSRVTDLEVRFERGRATFVAAAEGLDRVEEFFASGTGDPYVIAELGIGANPSLTEPYGSILMDEKIAGTVHLALGDNRTMGGANETSIHQDFIILAPRATCDGELLLADGELKI